MNSELKIGDEVRYRNPHDGFTDVCTIEEFRTSDDGLTPRAYIHGQYTRVITNLTNLTPCK